MKIGTTVPVTISGQQVTLATVKDFDPKTGHVTLEFPGTRAVMATRTEIVVEEREGRDVTELPTIAEKPTEVETPAPVEGQPQTVVTPTTPEGVSQVTPEVTVPQEVPPTTPGEAT